MRPMDHMDYEYEDAEFNIKYLIYENTQHEVKTFKKVTPKESTSIDAIDYGTYEALLFDLK